jgi:hypothetical protein
LLRVMRGARNTLLSLEHLSDDELDQLQLEFERLRMRAYRRESKPARE